MFLEDLIKFTNIAKKRGIYPTIRTIEGPSSGSSVYLDGKKYLSFSTNNYLGLAQDERLKEVTKKAIDKYGVGPASARLMSGNLDVYERLEAETAKFIGHESCVVFSSGYMANLGTISSLAKPPYLGMFSFFKKSKDVLIVSDELNHASIIDGCRLSKSDKAIFKHNDVDSLYKILKQNKNKEKFIIVDGIYSMDGDIAPLDKIVELKKEFGAALMIDDAHSTGVLGKDGRGTFEHFGLDPKDIDIIMGTYVKAFGGVGGFVCCSKDIADYLKVSARSYVFSICIPPAMAETMIDAIKIITEKPEIRKKLWENTDKLRNSLNEVGLDTLNSSTPIIPVLVGDEEKGTRVEEGLFGKQILAPCVKFPAVKKGMSRIRVSVMADHTDEQIEYFVDSIHNLYKNLKII